MFTHSIIKFLKTVDNNTKYTETGQIEMTIAITIEQDFSDSALLTY